MSNAIISQPTGAKVTDRGGANASPDRPLCVSRFDAVCSLLTAVMILLATWVLILWVAWMIDRSTTIAAATQPSIKRVSLAASDPVDVARSESGAHEHSPAFGRPSEQEVQRLLDPLMQFDRQLLTRSKIELEGRQVIKFIPQSLEKELAEMELEYARARGHSDVSEIAKTVFLSDTVVSASQSVLPPSEESGNRFRFRVVGQRYRKPRS